jgi:hypothetical protein
MKKIILLCTLLPLALFARESNMVSVQNPLEVVQTIGDKLVRETPFKYRLELAGNEKSFDKMKFVNFGRTFTTEKPAVAYAYTLLDAPDEMALDISIEHNDACKIWLNSELVYEKKTIKPVHLVYEERSIEMSYKARLNLKKGLNKLFIKSATAGNKDWCFYMQPPATKGAVLCEKLQYPSFAP